MIITESEELRRYGSSYRKRQGIHGIEITKKAEFSPAGTAD